MDCYVIGGYALFVNGVELEYGEPGYWVDLNHSSWNNQNLQRGLQTQQDEIQTHQLAIQNQQQQIQAQQQLIDSASQLANQVGPSVIRDLQTLQIQNKNQKIASLLRKYGIEAKSN